MNPEPPSTLLLRHHLKALKLPTMLRDYAAVAAGSSSPDRTLSCLDLPVLFRSITPVGCHTIEPPRASVLNRRSQQREAKEVIILKDVFELLERAIDRCRDAGSTIFQIVLKIS